MSKIYTKEVGLDEALRRFNRDVNKSGKLNDLKMHEFHLSKKERRVMKSELHNKKKKK